MTTTTTTITTAPTNNTSAGRASMAQLRAAVAALPKGHTLAGLFEAPTLAKLATTGKLEAAALSAVREWLYLSHSGTPLSILPEKAVKGALCPLPLLRTLRDIAPARNSGRTNTVPEWLETLETWLIEATAAGIKPTKATAQKTELEKARAYIKVLSPETMAALRAEGII